jgi:hypothetical protein
MGAFSGACLLAMAGAFIASQIYGNFEGAAAMSGGTPGAGVGAIGGAGASLWLILRQGGPARRHRSGRADGTRHHDGGLFRIRRIFGPMYRARYGCNL